MSFPRYHEYKASGVEWMGEVPQNWDLMRLKHVFRPLTEKTDRRDNPVALENIESWSGRFVGTESEFEGEGIAFEQGDILFGKLRPYLAKVYLASGPGEAVGDFHVLRSNSKVDDCFAQYQLLTQEFIGTVDGSTFGAKMPRVGWEFMGNMPFLLPPMEEQPAIAAFLDRETAKIDALVAEQEKLIALLKENRQAVILHAVTKGLNPDTPMKDSGIQWLGEIPTHWVTGALGYLASVNTGATPDRDNPLFWDGSIPWIKTGEVNYHPISEAEEYITERGLESSSTLVAEAGTLLMAMYGQGATRGRVAILGIAAAYNQACAGIRFGDRVIAAYGRYFFMASYNFIRDTGNETSQMNLSAGAIRKIRIAVPPLVEQTQVVDYLDAETAKIDLLISEAEQASGILRERRSALISAAVTGKIDVRGIATSSLLKPETICV